MWARIEKDRVIEVTDIDPNGRFHPAIAWEAVNKTVIPGMVKSGNGFDWPTKPIEDLVASINQQRKSAEAQGITHNGIRYAGSPEDRQALAEAIQFAQDAGITEFPGWKDSGGAFHANHPLADVEQAYRLIGQNRMRLIQLEGQYIAQVMDGTLTDVDGLVWS